MALLPALLALTSITQADLPSWAKTEILLARATPLIEAAIKGRTDFATNDWAARSKVELGPANATVVLRTPVAWVSFRVSDGSISLYQHFGAAWGKGAPLSAAELEKLAAEYVHLAGEPLSTVVASGQVRSLTRTLMVRPTLNGIPYGPMHRSQVDLDSNSGRLAYLWAGRPSSPPIGLTDPTKAVSITSATQTAWEAYKPFWKGEFVRLTVSEPEFEHPGYRGNTVDRKDVGLFQTFVDKRTAKDLQIAKEGRTKLIRSANVAVFGESFSLEGISNVTIDAATGRLMFMNVMHGPWGVGGYDDWCKPFLETPDPIQVRIGKTIHSFDKAAQTTDRPEAADGVEALMVRGEFRARATYSASRKKAWFKIPKAWIVLENGR